MNLLETYQAVAAKGRGPELVIVQPKRSSDARGGFATPSKPTLLPAGYQDPRTRAFTRVVVNPVFANDPKWQSLPDAQKQDLAFMIPPPEDLDRVALFAPPPPGFSWFNWPGGINNASIAGPLGSQAKSYDDRRDATWADIAALGQGAVNGALAWWRQAVALGPLPEDDELDDQPGDASFDWPKQGLNRKRLVYFWGFGKDGKLYQHMQLQKKNWFDEFQIFNKWGENLTFVKQPDGRWIAGWDFGDWFVQNEQKIIAGVQIAFQAIVMAVSLGAAAPGTVLSTMATTSALLAAQNALGAAFNGIAAGDFDSALKSIYNMGAALDSIPEVKAAIANNKDLQDFMKSEPMKVMGKITQGMKWPPSPEDILKRAALLGGQMAGQITPDLLKTARSQVPDQLLPFFDMAWAKGTQAIADRTKIPWYAQGAYDFGAALGSLVQNTPAAMLAQAQQGGGGGAAMSWKQALNMAQQTVTQGGGNFSVRQILEGQAGIHAPRKLPPDGSRSPWPASEKGSPLGVLALILAAVAAFFFFR